MPNKNPIYLNIEPVRTDFIIAEEHQEKTITLTVEINVEEDDWLYGSTNDVLLNGSYIFSSDTQEPKELKIGKASSLNDVQLRIKNRAFLIHPEGGANAAPNLTLKLKIFANGELIDGFEKTSDHTFFCKFYSWIQFEI